MTVLTETRHAGEFLVSEANGARSREEIVIAASQTLVAGQVLGINKIGTASAAAFAGNTGDGAMGAITVTAAKAGVYKLTIIEPATDGGTFQVEDPDGIMVGTGNVAVAFSGGGLAFTLADGASDFAAGDGFDITVAPGNLQFVAFDQDATNGAEDASAVLWDGITTGGSTGAAVAIVRDAEVNGGEITWPSDITVNEKDAGIAQLKALGIMVRT